MSRKEAAINVRVLIAEAHSQVSGTKTLRFPLDLSVAEALKEIRDRTEIGGQDHGLFYPGNDAGGGAKPYWLAKNRTLRYYGLKNNVLLHYKKIHRSLRLRLVDDSSHVVLIDDSASVAKINATIGEKLSLKSWPEYSLRKFTVSTGKVKLGEWLHDDQTLHEQGVKDSDELLFLKRYFFSDDYVDKEDPLSLHLLYVASQKAVVQGDYPVSKDEARDLAALQLQALYGDLDPARLKDDGMWDAELLLPPQYRKEKKLEKDVFAEYRKLAGMSALNAKLRYVEQVRCLKSYGITWFDCKRVVRGQRKPQSVRFGVTRSYLVLVDGKSREVLKELSWEMLNRWSVLRNEVTLDFGEWLADGYLVLLTDRAEELSSLLGGYIDLMLHARKDSERVVEDDDADIADIEVAETPAYALPNAGFIPVLAPVASVPSAPAVPATTSRVTLAGADLASLKSAWIKMKSSSEVELQRVCSASGTQARTGLATLLELARTQGSALDRNAFHNAQLNVRMEYSSLYSATKRLAAKNEAVYAPILEGVQLVHACANAVVAALQEWRDAPERFDSETLLRTAHAFIHDAHALVDAKRVRAPKDAAAAQLLAELAHHVHVELNAYTCALRDLLAQTPAPSEETVLELRRLTSLQALGGVRLRAWAPYADDAEVAAQLGDLAQRLDTELRRVNEHVHTHVHAHVPTLELRATAATAALDKLSAALATLQRGAAFAERDVGANESYQVSARGLVAPIHMFLNHLAQVRTHASASEEFVQDVKAAARAHNAVVAGLQVLVEHVKGSGDVHTHQRLLDTARRLTQDVQHLLDAARAYAQGQKTQDAAGAEARERVTQALELLEKESLSLISEIGAETSSRRLRDAAKAALAGVLKTVNQVREGAWAVQVDDAEVRAAVDASVHACEVLALEGAEHVRVATAQPHAEREQNALLEHCLFHLPAYTQLVEAVKRAVLKLDDKALRQECDASATELSERLRDLARALGTAAQLSTDASHEAALHHFDLIRAELEALRARIVVHTPQGLPRSTAPEESSGEARAMVALSVAQVRASVQRLLDDARRGLASALASSIEAIAAAYYLACASLKTLVPTLGRDAASQLRPVELALSTLRDLLRVIALTRALATHPRHPSLASPNAAPDAAPDSAPASAAAAEADTARAESAAGLSTLQEEVSSAVDAVARALHALARSIHAPTLDALAQALALLAAPAPLPPSAAAPESLAAQLSALDTLLREVANQGEAGADTLGLTCVALASAVQRVQALAPCAPLLSATERVVAEIQAQLESDAALTPSRLRKRVDAALDALSELRASSLPMLSADARATEAALRKLDALRALVAQRAASHDAALAAEFEDTVAQLRTLLGLGAVAPETPGPPPGLDLDLLAEQELMKCVRAIAEATQALTAARPSESPKAAQSVHVHDVNAAIVDAASAIAAATGALVEAAAKAQQARIQTAKESHGTNKYMPDPTWTNGLISAAQKVSSSVSELVASANEAASGQAQEEALIATAHAVASATAHLVSAARAKGDPASPTHHAIGDAARAVSSATAELVAAARTSRPFQEDDDDVLDMGDGTTTQSKTKELELQMSILRLEKELDRQRQKLNELRKARYVHQ